ncbi:CAAX protease self-immunity [Mesobacillus persicus]|uniref:CAAX protease self-immunity n=1 Tax=Mesobacillus persicus TaxID=930146 RepID=A0A1H8B5U2_9BACI|nr:CPBP family intramembrane glutamic endopeptidase [Mesobacillus persicus]SEM77408.1 CAAX protease self-immunity [Mesobacillus persicus]
MMNISELLLTIVLLLPGVLMMAINEKKLYCDLIPDIETPSFGLRLLNHIILAFPFALIGLFFYKKVGFQVFSFEGVSVLSLILSLLCAFLHVVVYYFYFKKNVARETYKQVEKSRRQLGIWTRTFYGGIVEEMIFRFGLMTFIVWICNLFISNSVVSIWIGNIVASIAFALAHLPAVYQMKVRVTRPMLIYSTSMNLLVGLLCGWLYWKEGLAAAILCHMLFHLVWYVFEKFDKNAQTQIGRNGGTTRPI